MLHHVHHYLHVYGILIPPPPLLCADGLRRLIPSSVNIWLDSLQFNSGPPLKSGSDFFIRNFIVRMHTFDTLLLYNCLRACLNLRVRMGGMSRDFDYNPGISVNLSRDLPSLGRQVCRPPSMDPLIMYPMI